jgi:hypothetical protein
LAIRVCFQRPDFDVVAFIALMRARQSGSGRAVRPQATAWVVGGSLLRLW